MKLELLAAVPAELRADAERALDRVHLDADVWFHSAEPVPHLSTVQEAVWQDRRLALSYRHSGGAIGERVVEPLGLVAKARVWYLVAAQADGLRAFRVGRIQHAALLDERFIRPPDFDLRAFWTEWRTRFERSIPRYPATLRVAPEALPRLQALLGEEARIALDRASPPDEAGWREVHVTSERLDDARRAVLACGGQIEALAPAELRRGVAAAIAALAALHASGDALTLGWGAAHLTVNGHGTDRTMNGRAVGGANGRASKHACQARLAPHGAEVVGRRNRTATGQVNPGTTSSPASVSWMPSVFEGASSPGCHTSTSCRRGQTIHTSRTPASR